MVYTKILVIRGFVLSLDKFAKAFGEDIKTLDDEDIFHVIYDLIDDFKKKFPHSQYEIFSYECCSKLHNKYVIFGKKIGEKKRDRKRCKNCEKYSLCDKCIGYMDSGEYYPVSEILDTIYEDISRETEYDENLKKEMLSIFKEDGEPKTYLMLDDCLSCT